MVDPEIWIYVDESGDPEPAVSSGEDAYFSLGALTVQTPITEEPINRALNNLCKDPDYLRQDPDPRENACDQRCLKRGYFHASLDSKNAHSHICREIAKLRPADFQLQGFDKTKASQENLFHSASARFHKNMVDLVVTKVSGSRIRRVNVCVAERQTFPHGVAKYWRDSFLQKLTASAAEYPQIPCYFPELNVQIVGGDEPGIQMADFLLWAVSRKYHHNPDRTWYDRAGLKLEDEWSEASGPLYQANFRLNERIPTMQVEHSKAPEDSTTEEQIIQYFRCAKTSIQRLDQEGLPTHASHLADEVNEVANLLKLSTISPRTINHVTSLTLRLADTVPLYESEDKQDVQFSINAKKWLGLVYLGRDIRWTQIERLWQQEHTKSLQ